VTRVKDVGFRVHGGEIVGIAGVTGNGQSELLEALAGLMTPSSGTIRLNGKPISTARGSKLAKAMRQAGVAHVPEDRQRSGLVGKFSAWESLILGYHDDPSDSRGALLHRKGIVARCQADMTEFDVRPPDPFLRTAAYSGGNQQKIVLAREIRRNPDLLLIGQPTRGVDIGAIEFIHRRLLAMRAAGKAILLVSVELDEILALADRILVMFDGRIVGELPREAATEARLGLMMAGIEEAA
jgi:simple sugar transport system ATP-binding protein